MSRLRQYWPVLLMGAAVVVAGLYGAWVMRQPRTPAAAEPPPVQPSAPAGHAMPEPSLDEETRRLEMQVAYADLEKARLLLNRQLGALNAKLWGRRLPAARAQSIQTDMMSASSLLTNPPLLGAFADVDEIRHEHDRVQAALARLEAIDSELPAGD